MGRLSKEALDSLDLRGPFDSDEIDRGFNQAIDYACRKIDKERKEREMHNPPQPPPGKQYYINGRLFTES